MIIEKFGNLFTFESKSKLKASEGLKEGVYSFYTSSQILSKRINHFQHKDIAIIFGTGGNPSIHYAHRPFSTSSDCFVTIPKDNKINVLYVYYYLFSNMYILKKGFKGAGIEHISKRYIQNIDIPIIDLITQQKIVSILNKSQSILNERDDVIDLSNNLMKSLFLDLIGDPSFNDKKWKQVPFNKVITKIESGWSPVCENRNRTSDNEWAILKLGSISKREFIAKENKVLIKGTKIKKEITANKGDILFSRKNTKDLVGAAAYVHKDYQKLLLPDTIFKLIHNDKINGFYLWFLLNDSNFRKAIQQLASGAVASMVNISKEKLRNLMIPLPPLKIQNDFSNKIIKIIKLREKLFKVKYSQELLFQSLSQKFYTNDGVNNLKLNEKQINLIRSKEQIKWVQKQLSSLTQDKKVKELKIGLQNISATFGSFTDLTDIDKELEKIGVPNIGKIEAFQKRIIDDGVYDFSFIDSQEKLNKTKNDSFIQEIGLSKTFRIPTLVLESSNEKDELWENRLNDPILEFIEKEQVGKLILNNYNINLARFIYEAFGSNEFDLQMLKKELKENQGLSNINDKKLKNDTFDLIEEFINKKLPNNVFYFSELKKLMQETFFNPSFELLEEFMKLFKK